MNIFILDKDPATCAKYHCDKHVVKMITESAQLLSNATTGGYRETHMNHPCSIWVRESKANFDWLKELAFHLHDEYRARYGSEKFHKSYGVICELPEPDLPDLGLTEFKQVMPEQYRSGDVVQAYRDYFNAEKQHIASWRCGVPFWYEEQHIG